MANEIRTSYTTGKTLYALIWDYENDKVWYNTGGVFETHGTSSRTNADYAITMTEIASGFYIGDWPTSMSAGKYDVVIKIQAGASPADGDAGYGPVEKQWTGTRATAVSEQNAVNVCNQALAKLSGGRDAKKISALGDGTNTSDLCDLLYTPIRKEVIARGQWQEIMKYGECAASSFSGEIGDWDYVCDLPSDCLHVAKQTHESNIDTEYPCQIMQHMILTNVYTNDDGDAAYIRYHFNETDASNFSQELVNAIATKLAAELAPQTLGPEAGYQRRAELLQEFERLVLPTNLGVNKMQQYHRNLFRHNFRILGGRTHRYV